MDESKSRGDGIRVLVIDDDEELCQLVTQYLNARGFTAVCAHTGLEGLRELASGRDDLAVLDVMLPDIDGFEVLRRLRADGNIAATPVLILTAHGDDVDRIVGLELGADDYLSKPFNPRELLARIGAILRRTAREPLRPAAVDEGAVASETRNNSPDWLDVGDIHLNPLSRSVRKAGEEISLTAVEFDLLHAMMMAAGRVVKRDELSRNALDRKILPFDRSLDIHMSKLRRKLGPMSGGSERIKTIRGVGYVYTIDND